MASLLALIVLTAVVILQMQRLPHNPKACKYQILIRIPAPAAVTTRLCGRRRTSRRSKEDFRNYCLLSVYITGAGALCLVSSMQPAAIWDLGRGCTVVQPVHSSEMVTKLSIFSIATLKHDPTQLPLFSSWFAGLVADCIRIFPDSSVGSYIIR